MSITDPKDWDDLRNLELWLTENLVDMSIEIKSAAGIKRWHIVLNGPCEEVESTGLTMRHALYIAIERYKVTVRTAA